jgi:hypothetical protein
VIASVSLAEQDYPSQNFIHLFVQKICHFVPQSLKQALQVFYLSEFRLGSRSDWRWAPTLAVPLCFLACHSLDFASENLFAFGCIIILGESKLQQNYTLRLWTVSRVCWVSFLHAVVEEGQQYLLT